MHVRRLVRPVVVASAVVAAGIAQYLATGHGRTSVAFFALGMLLFAWAEHGSAAARTPAISEPVLWPRFFAVEFTAACLLCVAAGVAVAGGAPPLLTHGLWIAGLVLLVLAVWCGRSLQCRVPALPRARLAAWAVLVTLCVPLFAWRLSTVPAEVHGDDAEVGNDAYVILEEQPFDLFRVVWFDLPLFHAVPTAIGIKLFGEGLPGLRGTSVVLGILSVLLLFSVATRLWGMEVGFLAAVFLAGGRYFIHLSRTGFHYIDTPFASLLVLWLFLRVWYDRRAGSVVLCGIVLGLAVQTYYASRLVPVLFALTWLIWILHAPRRDRPRRWSELAVVVVTALATAAPMIGYFSQHWPALWSRVRETSVFAEEARRHLAFSYGTDSLIRLLMIQAGSTFALFNKTPDTSLQYGYPGALFEPVTAVLFVLGLAGLGVRWRQERSRLVLLWLVLAVIAGGVLTIDAPFYPRISGALPFAALAAAFGASGLLSAGRSVMGERRARTATVIACAGLLGVVLYVNVCTYFFDYAPAHHLSPAVPISEWIQAHGRGKTTYMIGGAPDFFLTHGTIRFLTHGYATRDIYHLERRLRQDGFDRTRSVFVIMPAGEALVGPLLAAVGPARMHAHKGPTGEVQFYTLTPTGTKRHGRR